MKIKVKAHFDAAHRLVGYDGDCSKLHGHRWDVLVSFEPILFRKQNSVGMVVDFKDLKKLVGECLPDHEYLNDLPDLEGKNPTAENVVEVIYNRIDMLMAGYTNLDLSSVELFESPECSVEYSGGDF